MIKLKLNNKGFTNLEMFSIIVLFSVAYLVVLLNVSYAFEDDSDQIAYDTKISLIEACAQTYALYEDGVFDDEDTIYIYVYDLIEEGYLIADEDGLVDNPLESGETLNNLKIKLVYNNGEVEVSLVTI